MTGLKVRPRLEEDGAVITVRHALLLWATLVGILIFSLVLAAYQLGRFVESTVFDRQSVEQVMTELEGALTRSGVVLRWSDSVWASLTK